MRRRHGKTVTFGGLNYVDASDYDYSVCAPSGNVAQKTQRRIHWIALLDEEWMIVCNCVLVALWGRDAFVSHTEIEQRRVEIDPISPICGLRSL